MAMVYNGLASSRLGGANLWGFVWPVGGLSALSILSALSTLSIPSTLCIPSTLSIPSTLIILITPITLIILSGLLPLTVLLALSAGFVAQLLFVLFGSLLGSFLCLPDGADDAAANEDGDEY